MADRSTTGFYYFPQKALSTVNIAATYSDEDLVAAKVHSVGFKSNIAGSVFVFVSGTGEPIATIGNSSGTNYTVHYPRNNLITTAGVVIGAASGTNWEKIAVNGPIYYVGSTFTSGTSNTLDLYVSYD